jgi:hypothetical protein
MMCTGAVRREDKDKYTSIFSEMNFAEEHVILMFRESGWTGLGPLSWKFATRNYLLAS